MWCDPTLRCSFSSKHEPSSLPNKTQGFSTTFKVLLYRSAHLQSCVSPLYYLARHTRYDSNSMGTKRSKELDISTFGWRDPLFWAGFLHIENSLLRRKNHCRSVLFVCNLCNRLFSFSIRLLNHR